MRVDTGPGYRIYYSQHGQTLVIILCGGEKHGQDRNIETEIGYRQEFLRSMSEEKLQ